MQYKESPNKQPLVEKTDVLEENKEASDNISFNKESSEKVGGYLKEAGLKDCFPKEKERDLIKKAQEGSLVARNELIESNKGLVMFFAMPYYALIKENGIISFDDLVQEGNLGLVRTIEKFDPSYDVKFNTYAYFWIKQSVQRFVQNNLDVIRIPVHMRDSINKYKRVFSELSQELKHEPSVEQITQKSALSIEEILLIQDVLVNKTFSIDQRNDDTEDNPRFYQLRDTSRIPVDEFVHKLLLQKDMSKYLKKCLTEQEYKVLSLRYGLEGQGEHVGREIGEKMGYVSRQRIDQIERKAVEKLLYDPKIIEFKKGFDE